MSEGTSGVDSTATPAAGGQPVWDEDRVRLWLATADARERQLHPLRCTLRSSVLAAGRARPRRRCRLWTDHWPGVGGGPP